MAKLHLTAHWFQTPVYPLEGGGTHLDRPDPHPFPLFPPSLSDHQHHLPSPQPTPPSIYTSPCRFGYAVPVTGLYSSLPLDCPTGVQQDLGALKLPQDPGLESNFWGRGCTCSWAEKICGQNQCIGTLMERCSRFEHFTFSSCFSWHPQKASPPEKNNIHQAFWERRTLHFYSFLRQNMTVNIHLFILWVLPNMWHSPAYHLLQLTAKWNMCDLCINK